MRKYTNEEIADIKQHWPDLHKDYSVLSHLHRTNIEIDNKAYSLGLTKSDRVKSLILHHKQEILRNRNITQLGKPVTMERILNTAKKYKSKQEFRERDNSVYVTARRLGILDDLCKHMITGDSFNYPQTLLFICITKLFPNSTVRYNDRSAIYPKEIDVYVVEERIGFEYDGNNWHNEKDDLSKTNICEDNNIKLFRIKELRKFNQLPFILDALTSFGFDVSLLNADDIINEAFSKRMSKDDIINECLKYANLKDFREGNSSLYSFLSKQGKLLEYTGHITRRKSPTEKEILDKLTKVTTKSQFISEYHRYYIAMMKKKYHSCLERYNTL